MSSAGESLPSSSIPHGTPLPRLEVVKSQVDDTAHWITSERGQGGRLTTYKVDLQRLELPLLALSLRLVSMDIPRCEPLAKLRAAISVQ